MPLRQMILLFVDGLFKLYINQSVVFFVLILDY